jgi:hypothetical protein
MEHFKFSYAAIVTLTPHITSCASSPAHFGPGEREICHTKGKAGHTVHKAGSRLRDEVVFLQFVRPRWFLHWSTNYGATPRA